MRDAVKNKAAITYLANDMPTPHLQSSTHISIPTTGTEPLVIAKSAPTRFRKPGDTNNTEFYTAGAVLAAWLFREAGAAEYMRQNREAGYAAGFVSVTERKGIVDWLEGRRSSHDRLAPLAGACETTTPPGTPKAAHAGAPSGAVTSADAPATPAKRRYEPDKADVDAVKRIRQNEIELKDRTSVLRGSKSNNFTSVKNLISDKLKKIKDSSKAGHAQAAPKPDPKAANKKRMNVPIIIISSSPTALITLHNVKKFLEEAVYETPEQARAAGNAKVEDVIAVDRRRTHVGPGGKENTTRMRYLVVDSVEAMAKFGGEPWDRVVCVMTTGQAWQFRPYKWSEPLQLFHNVKGFYVAWVNDPPNLKIKDWNVSELRIDQYRRHVDKSVVAGFWKTLDAWVQANKPSLMMP
ncbi:RNA polymerase II-associated protein [Auricularia subglabra TFB-10046 SS5]|nr:RNA polymerase II-associated protein [Auricularia subglabra TFB-10046 SS5]